MRRSWQSHTEHVGVQGEAALDRIGNAIDAVKKEERDLHEVAETSRRELTLLQPVRRRRESVERSKPRTDEDARRGEDVAQAVRP